MYVYMFMWGTLCERACKFNCSFAEHAHIKKNVCIRHRIRSTKIMSTTWTFCTMFKSLSTFHNDFFCFSKDYPLSYVR
jgi:hypothetical protein